MMRTLDSLKTIKLFLNLLWLGLGIALERRGLPLILH